MEYSLPSVYTLGVACLVIPSQDPEEQTKVTTMECTGPFHILSVHSPNVTLISYPLPFYRLKQRDGDNKDCSCGLNLYSAHCSELWENAGNLLRDRMS